MGNSVPFGLLPRFGLDQRSVIVMPHLYGFSCRNTAEADTATGGSGGVTSPNVTRVLPQFPAHRYDAYAPFLKEWVDGYEFSATVNTVNLLLQRTHPSPCFSACCMDCLLLGCCGDDSRLALLTYPLLAERFLLQFSAERNAGRPAEQHVVWSLVPLVPGVGTSINARHYPLVYLNIRLPAGVVSGQFDMGGVQQTGMAPITNHLDGTVTMQGIGSSGSGGGGVPTNTMAAPNTAVAASAVGAPATPVMSRTADLTAPKLLPPTPTAAGGGGGTGGAGSSAAASAAAASAGQVQLPHTMDQFEPIHPHPPPPGGGHTASADQHTRFARLTLLTQTATAQAQGVNLLITSPNPVAGSGDSLFCSRCGVARKNADAVYCHKCGSTL